MLFTSSDRIFDTLIDTHPKRVTMIKSSFYLRKDYNVSGQCAVYLQISGGGFKRERFPIDLYVEPVYWDEKGNTIKAVDQQLYDKKLIMENVVNKLTEIRTIYRLSNMVLTPSIMRAEFENKLSRVNFVAFFLNALKEDKVNLCAGTYDRHLAVYKKLYEYQSHVPFNSLTLKWFNTYKEYLKNNLGNKDTTIAANMASIKKFLMIAQDNGIKLLFDIRKMEVGDTRGNRNYLSAVEVNNCLEYYLSGFIKPSWRLILGYFLFSCMNGLRISNVQRIEREELLHADFSVIMVKGNKDRNLGMNKTVKRIIEHDENLFVKKYSDQEINRELKSIMTVLGIKKKVTFHVARHTFATLFLKAGGKIEKLQKLLGHSSITQTMIYSHIVETEANEEMFLLDNLFTK